MNKESKRVIIHMNFGADTTYGQIQTVWVAFRRGKARTLDGNARVRVLRESYFRMESSQFSFWFAFDVFNSTHRL